MSLIEWKLNKNGSNEFKFFVLREWLWYMSKMTFWHDLFPLQGFALVTGVCLTNHETDGYYCFVKTSDFIKQTRHRDKYQRYIKMKPPFQYLRICYLKD